MQQPRFEQQRLAKRRGDAQDRLVREGDGALGHRQDFPGEAELGQLLQEARVVVADLSKEAQVIVGVAEVAHEIERRLDPRDEHVRALIGGAAGEEVEGGQPVAPGAPTDVGGIGVVEIGQ